MTTPHDINPLISLYQRVEAATTRKEVKAILSDAEKLQQRLSPHGRNIQEPLQH